jgi:hypothetical protein
VSDKKIDLILNKLESMDKRLDRNEEMISTLMQIVGTTNSKVEELQTDVSLLLDNQKTIMQLQQDQQKILERLSIRSISHEADIAEIRRIK